VVIASAITILTSYLVASRIKRGDMTFVWLERFFALSGSIFSVLWIIQSTVSATSTLVLYTPFDISRHTAQGMVSLYVLYALFRFNKEFKLARDSYAQQPDFDTKKDRFVRALGILFIFAPILYSLYTSFTLAY
jgi:formate-dependent nitrite reductase membrane component NrfD